MHTRWQELVRESAPSRKRRPRLAAVAMILAALVVAVVMYAGTRTHRARGEASPQPAASTSAATAQPTSNASSSAPAQGQSDERAAFAWIRNNLPHRVAMLADPATVDSLTALGFTAARSTPGASPPPYVVSGPSLRSTSSMKDILSRSVSIARFGGGPARVEVRFVLGVSGGQLSRLLATDRSNRVLAGTELAATRG